MFNIKNRYRITTFIMILLMALYTCMTFVSFKMKTRKSSDFMLAEMTFIMLLLQFVAYLVLYLKLGENEDLIYYYGFQALFMVLITILWRLFYKDIHSTVLSNLCMMITTWWPKRWKRRRTKGSDYYSHTLKL